MKKYLLFFTVIFIFANGNVFGQNAAALSLTNHGMFRVLDHPDLDVTGDFTIECWVKINSDSFKGRLCDREGTLKIYATAYSIRFDLDGGGSISTGNISAGIGEWHHIAVSRSGTATRMFYDGEMKSSYNLALSAGTKDFSIGGQDGWYPAWDAVIDEFRFSNVARYTNDFIPQPTDEPFTPDANTILLFHFNNPSELPPVNDGTNYPCANGRSTGVYMLASTDYVDASGLPLPVELNSFTATSTNNEVVLNWATATETNNYGFEVERALEGEEFETITFVQGFGSTNAPKSYSYNDKVAEAGNYSYRLKQIDLDGVFEYSKTISVSTIAPESFEVSQNYPNPFNPTTTINFKIPQQSNVTLKVYNTIGETVAELVNDNLDAGSHSVIFNASNLPSGVYIYRISTDYAVQTMKMTLLK